MKRKRTRVAAVIVLFALAGSARCPETDRLVLRLVGPDGNAVSDAKVGTGINVFENSEGHPPQTIVMWLRGRRREWPFRSDESGRVVLTGGHDQYRQFYAVHEARGWAGYEAFDDTPADGEVEIRLEPACHVHGQLTSEQFKQLGHPLRETVVFLFDADRRQVMYFVSERARYEFLLPAGEYVVEMVGKGPNGARTQRLEKALKIDPGQRQVDLGVLDLPATKLASLFDKPAPELADMAGWVNGEAMTLERLRGRPVVLEFWGCWCGPCIQTMPELIGVYEEFEDWGVAFIAIHDTTVKTVDALEEKLAGISQDYWDGKELAFPVALDGGEGRGAIHRAYGVRKWPTTLLIGRNGKLVGEFSPWGELQAELRLMLGLPIAMSP